ncbi:hypothetical protein SFC76_19335 [Sphingomonas sp. CD22]|uniref:hypothetical protein n=1 Tax=Sphingomonas sp. CD22 TaxID=3100214 RepID=UPI002ADF0BBC|nr:hypothetical protein [Sphingomonas sp. CD22]MEA1086432.1 hypothetical protein [Sphingomonas sp. CD22]
MILVNNDGYTVERAIHGAEQSYNDIATWNWQLLPQALGDERRSLCLRAATGDELAARLNEAREAVGMVLLEVITPVQDVPGLLAAITRSVTGAAVHRET